MTEQEGVTTDGQRTKGSRLAPTAADRTRIEDGKWLLQRHTAQGCPDGEMLLQGLVRVPEQQNISAQSRRMRGGGKPAPLDVVRVSVHHQDADVADCQKSLIGIVRLRIGKAVTITFDGQQRYAFILQPQTSQIPQTVPEKENRLRQMELGGKGSPQVAGVPVGIGAAQQGVPPPTVTSTGAGAGRQRAQPRGRTTRTAFGTTSTNSSRVCDTSPSMQMF